MAKLLLSGILLLYGMGIFAQNQVKIDERINKKILHGMVTLEAFDTDICKNWYGPEYTSYKIRKGILAKLKKKNLQGISIKLIFGTWCHDTHREVPRFLKILDAINFPFEHLHMNALDTKKTIS